MILLFGGTTEGRTAADVCEQAARPFYYSTRTDGQDVPLANGIHITGDMDATAIEKFCEEHAIRLIVDAAHPFATSLHKNIVQAAEHAGLPVVRFDRIYPPRREDITWCSDWEHAMQAMNEAGIERLLALTGVNTIRPLRDFWQTHTCWWRILDREESRLAAASSGFPTEQLVYYEHATTAELISRLHPDAIITKESGASGGFDEKVDSAIAAGVKVFAVERPPYPAVNQPSVLYRVEGRHGLRRTIEQIVPDFYELHTGLTTGTCAAAAAKAAMLCLMGQKQDQVLTLLPEGEHISVDVIDVHLIPDADIPTAEASIIKDFSDDPDVTRGCRITARVSMPQTSGQGVRFLQGEGVGRVTLPGLGIPVGSPAINTVPRQVITDEVRSLTNADVDVEISVEGGRELAAKTFNSRVGVVDGISIIGSKGIVWPLSNEAFIESIGRELSVAKAMGHTSVGLASGRVGEEALLELEPDLRVIHYGNFIGAALEHANRLGFKRAVVGILIGKAVKLAEGNLDTHSHKVLMNKSFLADVAASVGIPDVIQTMEKVSMARELWSIMPNAFFDRIHDLCVEHCRKVFPDGELIIHLINTPSNQ